MSVLSRIARVGTVAAALGAVAIPLLKPAPAQAWWYHHYYYGPGYWGPRIVVAPPVVYAPPPVVYAPRPYYHHRYWVGAHWNGPYWVPGHWGWV